MTINVNKLIKIAKKAVEVAIYLITGGVITEIINIIKF